MPSPSDRTSAPETEPRPATFSIAARDPATDAVGVAVHSKFVSVGSVVPFVSADAGAIATQSFANVAYGPDGLDLLRAGHTAENAIEELTAEDADAPLRQVGIVSQAGSVAAFTGEDCFEYAGSIQGETYTVQGNILENRATLEAMASAFESGGDEDAGNEPTDTGFPERLLAALQAGNEAGGDKRGEQGAALYVAKPEGGYDGGNDRWIDVRVDDHENPIAELERVFKLYDVTLLERKEPDDLQALNSETANEVLETLVELGLYEGSTMDGDDVGEFGEAEREALEDFRSMNNFENHSTAVLEDAIARGWDAAEGRGEERLIDAVWHGLSRLERR
ncbi:DUF1028 domain-containing protein [Halobacteriales archaeon QS_3_64_16]|nr:MAG: DUF1028 domain-containing protein [Halobacteriales archaeon QS_3_64_16]